MWSTNRLRPAALAALLAVGACAHAPIQGKEAATNGRDQHALTPLDQYPLRAVEKREGVALAVHAQGVLSPAQDAALAGLAQTWRETGDAGALVIEHPAAGGPDAQLTAQAAADRLVALGVAPSALRLGAYDGADPGAPITAHFQHMAVDAPDCAKGWDNLVATNGNGVSTHFGCASARNFAVMLADPHDLQGPRGSTPADAGRRAVVLDNYRKGVVTSSAKDDQANGAVSKAVN